MEFPLSNPFANHSRAVVSHLPFNDACASESDSEDGGERFAVTALGPGFLAAMALWGYSSTPYWTSVQKVYLTIVV